MSRVLITGAAGFLGRHFLRWHVNAGDEVVGVDDMSNPHSQLVGADQLFVSDAADFFLYGTNSDDPVERDFDGPGDFDLAYHFAAPVGGREQIENDPLVNADSLRLDAAFFRWAVKHAKVAVYPSSSAVYGIRFQTGYERMRLRESFIDLGSDMIPVPDELYGYTKLIGEVLASKAEGYGLNTLCIRPFSGYGEDQPPTYPMRAIAERVKKREDPLTVWGTGLQKRDFVHVDDIVGATVARLETGVSGYQAMNIGSGEGTSFLELAHLMALTANYSPTVLADNSKPQGVMSRIADVGKMLRWYTPQVSLAEGVERVLGA